VDEGEYHDWVQQALAILKGKTGNAIRFFEEKMERAAAALRFEEAAMLRDRIAVLEQFSRGKQTEFAAGEQRDAWALHREGRNVTIAVLTTRNGRLADSKQFALADAEAEDEAILETVLEQHYEAVGECPDEILMPEELQNTSILVQRLSAGRSARVVLTAPKIGSKARLVALAQVNAREYFSSVFDGELRYLQAANKLTELMRLSQTPRRIECVDISNLQGTDVVGAIVVYFDGVPARREFRRYIIKNQRGQDDFAAMYEVVSRRLDRGMQTGELPDLLVIDGGPGQLAMALKARDERGVPLDIISIAKMRLEKQPGDMEPTRKPERLHAEWTEAATPLEDASEVTHLLSRIRDEVHKYVITFHRERRAKRMFQSRLDSIPGLGPERRQRLLKVYGSSSAVLRASAEEIAATVKMPRTIAEEVLRRLRKSV
jgi:excinuclease ABC subunit C